MSVVHSRTKNPEEFTREADIIISAVGQANMVKGSWIKPGAVIIDVGINPVEVGYLHLSLGTSLPLPQSLLPLPLLQVPLECFVCLKPLSCSVEFVCVL